MPRRRLCLLVLSAAAALLAGCGGGDGASEAGNREATLVLDFLPGPVHAGVYRALERGYYEAEGIDLEIVEPSATADTLRLVESGRAQLGIGEGIDIATQVADGRPVQAILALTQRPLGGLITLESSGIRTPADLEGRTVGVTGVPSDDAVVKTIVAGGDGDPEKVRTVTIGFGGVQALLAGRVDAFTGFIPSDAVAVELEGRPTRSFAVDEYGGPRYPGLVVFSTQEMIGSEPELLRGFARATVRGYEEVLADPAAGLRALLAENPEIPRDFGRASLRAHLPLFAAGGGFGGFDYARIAGLSRFLLRAGLISEPFPPRRFATSRFLPAG